VKPDGKAVRRVGSNVVAEELPILSQETGKYAVSAGLILKKKRRVYLNGVQSASVILADVRCREVSHEVLEGV